MRFQRIHDTLLGYDAAPAYGQERASRVVHSGRHAYLFLRQAASAQRFGALVRLAGHDEHGGLGMVALEGFTEVRLIQLHARSSLGTQNGRVPSDAFDDPLTHEERGLQTHTATFRALTQTQTIHEAFEKTHPHASFEFAHAHHPVRTHPERTIAIHALPAL